MYPFPVGNHDFRFRHHQPWRFTLTCEPPQCMLKVLVLRHQSNPVHGRHKQAQASPTPGPNRPMELQQHNRMPRATWSWAFSRTTQQGDWTKSKNPLSTSARVETRSSSPPPAPPVIKHFTPTLYRVDFSSEAEQRNPTEVGTRIQSLFLKFFTKLFIFLLFKG